jgi:hypothetical protein
MGCKTELRRIEYFDQKREIKRFKKGLVYTGEPVFKTSEKMLNSCTKFIQAEQPADCDFLVCDTPGFEDRGGPMEDIPNAAGIISGLRGSKGARFFVTVAKAMVDGPKMSMLQNTLQQLCNFLRDPEACVSSIQIVFTQYKDKGDETKESIRERFFTLQGSFRKSENSTIRQFPDNTRARVSLPTRRVGRIDAGLGALACLGKSHL